MRALLSDDVIREWDRRRAAFRRSEKTAWIVLILFVAALVVPAIAGLVRPFPWLGAVAVIAGFGFIYLRNRHQFILKCPNCGKHPGVRFGQLLIYEADSCAHCHAWLLQPQRPQ